MKNLICPPEHRIAKYTILVSDDAISLAVYLTKDQQRILRERGADIAGGCYTMRVKEPQGYVSSRSNT